MPRDLGRVQLETLLAHTGLAVAATDLAGRFTLFSPALARLLGEPYEPADELAMVRHYDLGDPDRHPLSPEDFPLARALRGQVVNDALITTTRADGDTCFLRCNAAPLRDEQDLIFGAVVLVQDVTAEHAAKCEQDELRDRLVDTINHEMRTPVTKLVGHSELLQENREQFPEPLAPSVDVISRSASELQQVTALISALADLESHARLVTSTIDLAGLLRSCLEACTAAASRRALRLSSALPDRLEATVDPGEVRRAVCALLDNALRYAPDGTEVELRLTADGSRIRIDVRDEGSGIAAQDRARLIEPFERGEHPQQQLSSKGLGLTLAHTVAAAHGGELVLGDHRPQGLVASLVLPSHP